MDGGTALGVREHDAMPVPEQAEALDRRIDARSRSVAQGGSISSHSPPPPSESDASTSDRTGLGQEADGDLAPGRTSRSSSARERLPTWTMPAAIVSGHWDSVS